MKTNKLLGYLLVFLFFIVLPFSVVYYGIYLTKDKTVLNWLPNVDDKEKINRTLKRGTLGSIILTLSSIIQISLKSFGGSKVMLLLLYGFFMANVLGFMIDQGFGTDDGFSLGEIGRNTTNNEDSFKARIYGLGAKLKYVFGSLTTSKFWRFIITVFLDLFISSPIQSIIVAVSGSSIAGLKSAIPAMVPVFGSLLSLILNNFDSILQSFVALITFLAYTNELRFKWAYPATDIDSSLLIKTESVKLATSIGAVIYLVSTVSSDYSVSDGSKIKSGQSLVDRLDRKLIFVLIVIGLLSIGSLDDNSFLNYSAQRYAINPIQNYKTNEFWNYDNSINKQIDNYITKDKKDKCKNKKIGYLRSCKVDSKSGNIVLTDDKIEELDNPLKNDAEEKLNIDEKTKELNWEKPRPCFIPDHKYLCQCGEYDPEIKKEYKDYIEQNCKKEELVDNETNEDSLNKYNGNFLKKIDMGVYLKHSSRIENKYDIIRKSNKGFLILCLYIFIGFIIPFIPSKMIYNNDEYKNSKIWKLITVIIICYGIALTFYFISKKCPNVKDLVKSEESIINKKTEKLFKNK